MESRIELKETISYPAIKNQILSLYVLKEFRYDASTSPANIDSINSIIINLPKIPIIDMGMSPSLHDINVSYQKIINHAIKNKCTLLELYQCLFENFWNADNIAQLKHATKLAFEAGTIPLSSRYHLDMFLEKLNQSKKKVSQVLDAIKDESYCKSFSHIDKEMLQARSIYLYVQKSGLLDKLIQAVEQVFAESLQGWADYKEARERLLRENKGVYASLSESSSFAKKEYDERIYELELILKEKESLFKEHELHKAAMKYLTIDLNHLEPVVDFINAAWEKFPDSFKKHINQRTIEEYMQHCYADKFPNENIRMIYVPTEPIENKIAFDYIKIKKDFKLMNKNWKYIQSLENFMTKDLYRIAALQMRLDSYDDVLNGFCDTWHDQVNMLLIGKELKTEAKVAVVQAALDCIVYQANYLSTSLSIPYLEGYDTNHADISHVSIEFGKIRKKILNDMHRKEQQYFHEMPWGDGELARTLLLRLIAINYIRNKILSLAELNSRVVTEELISQFGEDTVATRGCFPSFISKLLQKLDIPKASAQGIFAKNAQGQEMACQPEESKNEVRLGKIS